MSERHGQSEATHDRRFQPRSKLKYKIQFASLDMTSNTYESIIASVLSSTEVILLITHATSLDNEAKTHRRNTKARLVQREQFMLVQNAVPVCVQGLIARGAPATHTIKPHSHPRSHCPRPHTHTTRHTMHTHNTTHHACIRTTSTPYTHRTNTTCNGASYPH